MVDIRMRSEFLNDDELPSVLFVERGANASVEEITEYMRAARFDVRAQMDRCGAVLMRGFANLDSAAAFEAVVGAFMPNFMDYVGGTSPRRKIHGKIVSSTELDPDVSLPLHQEMVYTDGGPDVVAFFCLQPARRGGATTLGNMSKVLQRLPTDLVSRFEDQGIRLRRTLPPQARAAEKAGVSKSWEEVFQTERREDASRIATERGWAYSWLPGDFMQVAQELRPATARHPRTHERVWYNQAHIFSPTGSLRWARRDGRHQQEAALVDRLATAPEMLDQVLHRDGTEIDASDIEAIWDALEACEVELNWERGDLLLIDNVACAHGRRSFEGPRTLLAALLTDEPRSQGEHR